MLPKPVSYADLSAIAGAVGVFNTGGPLIKVGYGRPDVDVADPNAGVGANTNQQKDYPIAELMDEWSEAFQPCLQSSLQQHLLTCRLMPWDGNMLCCGCLGSSCPLYITPWKPEGTAHSKRGSRRLGAATDGEALSRAAVQVTTASALRTWSC